MGSTFSATALRQGAELASLCKTELCESAFLIFHFFKKLAPRKNAQAASSLKSALWVYAHAVVSKNSALIDKQ
ncbi:MAG: hypothetical protein V4563_03500 [Pseudomonadota bacterium]